MSRLVLAMLVVVAFQSSVYAGAKDGPIRWSHKRTGAAKTNDALAVPAAKGEKAGKIELKVTFEGGKLAEFALIGDGDSDLDVVIKDAAGNVVAKDDGGVDICICRWTPKETAEFVITVTNPGKLLNIAQAATN